MSIRKISGPPAKANEPYQEMYYRPTQILDTEPASTVLPQPLVSPPGVSYENEASINDEDISEVEDRLSEIQFRLDAQANATKYLSDTGPHDPNYDPSGDAMHALWARTFFARQEERTAVAAAIMEKESWERQRKLFRAELAEFLHRYLVMDLVDDAVSLSAYLKEERRLAEEAEIEAINQSEAHRREELRRAAYAAEQEARIRAAEIEVASSDPAIEEIRRQTRARLTAQDADAAAAEEEEVARLEAKLNGLSQVKIPQGPAIKRELFSTQKVASRPMTHTVQPTLLQNPTPSLATEFTTERALASAAIIATNEDCDSGTEDYASLMRREQELKQRRQRVVGNCVQLARDDASLTSGIAQEAVAATRPRACGIVHVRSESTPGSYDDAQLPTDAATTYPVAESLLPRDTPARVSEPPPTVFRRTTTKPPEHTSYEFISTVEMD